MASIKLKFRAHTDNTKEGVLYFQIIHNRTVKQVKTDYHIYEYEWDRQRGDIVKDCPLSAARNEVLKVISDKVVWEQRKLEQIVKSFECSGNYYTTNDIIRSYKESAFDKTTVFEYMRRQSERMKMLGKVRTGETYRQTLNSFMRFRNGVDLYFDMLDADMVERYESYRLGVRMYKTEKTVYIPLSKQAMKWMPERGDKSGDDYVFDSVPSDYNKHIAAWAKAAGITKHITHHCGRHTFATMLLSLGVDIYTVSKLLGHASLRHTQRYAKIVDRQKDDAVNLADRAFE